MKRLIFIACTPLFAFSCNNTTTSDGKKKGTDSTTIEASTEKPDYPYSPEKPHQEWQIGDPKNSLMALKMLKAWETKNLAECVTYFGDTVDMRLDMYHEVLPHDSMLSLLNMSRGNMTSINIQMQDWVSVISKDKKSEWVTLWYKQKWIDDKGKADSANMVNDAKFINGKITIFDEKVQHFAAAKK